MPGPPRRRPYPFDMRLADVPLMLGRPRKDAPLVATRVQPFLQDAPDAYSYDTQNPLTERVQPWDDLTLGFGLRMQKSYADRKYRYALGADLSIGGLWLKGPEIQLFTPAVTDSANGILRFFESAGSLYAVGGRYALVRASDTAWGVSCDFGSGAVALDAVPFTSSGSGLTYTFVALGDGQPLWYQVSGGGGSWGANSDGLTARSFAVVGRDFYRASDINQLSKVDTDADPTRAANWSNANSFRVGDKSSPIVSLAVDSTGSLLVFKRDGVYTLDDAGQDRQLFPFTVSGAADSENGRYWGSYGNDTHVSYGRHHLRLSPTVSFGHPHLVLEEVGPEKLAENDSPVKGRVTAFLGHGELHAYAGLYDDDTQTSYLLKMSSYITPSVAPGTVAEGKRVDAWHGSLSRPFPGRKITALYRSTAGAAAGHYRCYMGFSDGSLGWFTLPCVPNPAGCSAYTYTTDDAHVFLPLWHGTFQSDAKVMRAFSVLGQNLGRDASVRIQYRPDPSQEGYTPLGAPFAATPRVRIDCPGNVSTFLADIDVTLQSSGPSVSPQVTGVALHHAVRPALIEEYTFDVLAADGLVARDGRPLRTGAAAIREAVRSAAAGAGSVAAVLPDESAQDLTVTDYGEALAWDERGRRWQASLHVRAVQYRTNAIYGTWARLGAYPWSYMQAQTWEQASST